VSRWLSSKITGYLVLYAEVGAEILRALTRFFADRWRRFGALPALERLFAVLSVVLMIFTFLPWRSYTIQFGDNAPRSHGIYSDDFGVIIVGCILALLPLLWALLPRDAHALRNAQVYRYVGLAIVAVFALWNWVNPTRIAASTEATFTWNFFAFEALTVFWIVTGVLGANAYAQYPVKN